MGSNFRVTNDFFGKKEVFVSQKKFLLRGFTNYFYKKRGVGGQKKNDFL